MRQAALACAAAGLLLTAAHQARSRTAYACADVLVLGAFRKTVPSERRGFRAEEV